MTANPWRGEVEIVLDGRKHILRPTFDALARIEGELSCGLLALARRLAEGALTLEEMAVIVRHCLAESAPEKLNEALLRGGVAYAMERTARLFAAVLGGDDGAGA